MINGSAVRFITSADFEKFSQTCLNLGELTTPSVPKDAVAAIFDLDGFTAFCKQIDPQLGVPSFMNLFLSWLIGQLRKTAVVKELVDGYHLRHPLPFFTKFLGDGILVLWDVEAMNRAVLNIINTCMQTVLAYEHFRKTLVGSLSAVPKSLRCGVARGRVYSVGSGYDYIGSCINMASRMQKMPGTLFAFNIRGFDLSAHPGPLFKDYMVVKKVRIRGIGDDELVAVPKIYFSHMAPTDAASYEDPD